MSADARREAMSAADLVGTYSIREAAVLGGIVRCIIETGGCEAGYISEYVRGILDLFDHADVDRTAPCAAEIAIVLQRFEEVYGRVSAD
jgi:hypothetical protein